MLNLEQTRMVSSALWRRHRFPKDLPSASAYGYQHPARHPTVVCLWKRLPKTLPIRMAIGSYQIRLKICALVTQKREKTRSTLPKAK